MRCGRCGRDVYPDESGGWYSVSLTTSGETGEVVETGHDLNCDDGYPHGPIRDV